VDNVVFQQSRLDAETEHVPQTVLTEFARNARELDAEKGGKPYWSTTLEKFARAFDAFVSDELEARQAKNEYLSHAGRSGATVPMGDEREVVNSAFRALVGEVKSRETEQGVALFSLGAGEAVKGMPVAVIEAEVARMRKAWPSMPGVSVVRSVDDLTIDVKRHADGVYYDGRVYVVAENIVDLKQLQKVMAHECVLHHSLEEMLGEYGFAKLNSGIQALKKKGDPVIGELAADIRTRYGVLPPEQETKEIVARAGEKCLDDTGNVKIGFGFMKSVFAGVAGWLRDHGFKVPFSNTELQGIMHDAGKWIQRDWEVMAFGSKPALRVDGAVLESLGKVKGGGRGFTELESFKRWFGDSKVVDGEGKPLVMVHASPKSNISIMRKGSDGAMWFSPVLDTSEADIVASYGNEFIENPNPYEFPDVAVGSTFYPAYLAMQNPATGDMANDFYNGDATANDLINLGFDGVQWDDGVVAVFSPTQIKSAIGNNLEFDAQNPNILCSFAGVKAENAPLEKLKAAREMQAAEVDDRVIWRETGWTFGFADGKPRFEIADDRAEVNIAKSFPDCGDYDRISTQLYGVPYGRLPFGENGALGEKRSAVVGLAKAEIDENAGKILGNISHPELMAGYPSIAALPVSLFQNESGYVSGVFSGSGISADAPAKELKSTVLHELQHAIQNEEQFARGGSPTEFKDVDLTDKELSRVNQEVHQLYTQNEDFYRDTVKANQLHIAVMGKYGTTDCDVDDPLVQDWWSAIDARDSHPESAAWFSLKSVEHLVVRDRVVLSPEVQYRQLAGEVEARLTQARKDMSTEERAGVYPVDQMDVAVKDQMVRFGVVEARRGVLEGSFSGKILDVADGVAVQKVGREGETVRHVLSRLSDSVAIGDVVDIRYKDGRGVVGGRAQVLER